MFLKCPGYYSGSKRNKRQCLSKFFWGEKEGEEGGGGKQGVLWEMCKWRICENSIINPLIVINPLTGWMDGWRFEGTRIYSILPGHGEEDINTGAHMFFQLVTKSFAWRARRGFEEGKSEVQLASCKVIRRGGSRGGARGAPLLFLDPTEARRAEK